MKQKLKKRWAWSSKNIRRSASKNDSRFSKGPSKSFSGCFKSSDKAKLKQSLVKELNGYDETKPNRTYRNTAKWMWW